MWITKSPSDPSGGDAGHWRSPARRPISLPVAASGGPVTAAIMAIRGVIMWSATHYFYRSCQAAAVSLATVMSVLIVLAWIGGLLAA